jgi:N-hydroxyarylamine O-acetyltransferase
MAGNLTPAQPPAVDVEAYCRRIGYAGPRAATLETLRAIHLRHPLAIAFENLDPFLRRAVHLDLASLERKIVHAGRGGYCFEQNLLLQGVLQLMGFRVSGLAGRVLWNAPEGAVRPRGHMLLRIDLDDHIYVADVGFGGLTLTAPLLLVADIEQATPHETFRLARVEGDYLMQVSIRGAWKSLYRFDLQPQLLPDYEVTNWYLSNHPQSHFVSGLLLARVAEDRRYGLLDNRLSIHHMSGESEQRILGSVAELRAALEDTFGLDLSRLPQAELDAALERLV